MAHSRGTDVLASALRELNIEAYVAGASIADRFKLKNIVLLAPDIDADVASAKIFGVVSDPDLAYGAAPRPRKVFSGPGVHITCYMSWSDKALTLSQFLYGSVERLGRLDFARLKKQQAAGAVRLAYLVDFVEVQGARGFIGHSYFTSDPAVSSDLIALIRYGLKPGEPGRPLEEIRRPFWRIPAGTDVPAAYPPQTPAARRLLNPHVAYLLESTTARAPSARRIDTMILPSQPI
jgi:esterase/lipase superfamily enzyme